jgi:hypothetical protein
LTGLGIVGFNEQITISLINNFCIRRNSRRNWQERTGGWKIVVEIRNCLVNGCAWRRVDGGGNRGEDARAVLHVRGSGVVGHSIAILCRPSVHLKGLRRFEFGPSQPCSVSRFGLWHFVIFYRSSASCTLVPAKAHTFSKLAFRAILLQIQR